MRNQKEIVSRPDLSSTSCDTHKPLPAHIWDSEGSELGLPAELKSPDFISGLFLKIFSPSTIFSGEFSGEIQLAEYSCLFELFPLLFRGFDLLIEKGKASMVEVKEGFVYEHEVHFTQFECWLSSRRNLEDLVWDDFCQSDDHIVPHSGTGSAVDHSILGDSHKKPCCVVTSFSNSTGDISSVGYVHPGRDQRGFPSLNKRTFTMLENDSWCNTPSGVSPSESNSIREASSVASENTTSSHYASKSNKTESKNHETCANDNILSDKNTDNSSFGKALGDITHPGNNLSFFENAENKDSTELLFYGWPEIGNFDDVDRMFSSCDSTFGLGSSKEDGLGWFESADNVGGSGDIVKPEFEFPYPEPNPVECNPQQHDSSKNDFLNDFSMMGDGSWISEKSDSYMSFVNGPAMANSKDSFIPKEQISDNKNKVKLQAQYGKTKETYLENGSFNFAIDLPNEAVQLPPSYVHSNNSPSSDLTSINPAPSSVKSETHGLISPRNPSHASIQLHTDPKFSMAAPVMAGKTEKLHNRQGKLSSAFGSLENANAAVPVSIAEPGFTGKQVQYSGDKSEKHGDPGGASLLIPAELGSSHIQERSTMNSGVDDVSQEAVSFRQLKLVMKQLDSRTKICIRDSLYRLARSAEQRHNHANLNDNGGAERDAGGALLPAGANNFMDIETDTNPIDRSIAHLLFHRPPEPSNTIRGSVTDPPVMVDNMITCEENASKIENDTDR
ncbi:dentin sialophospho protein [Striga asiatica]|uniref:Dentin sialophospho protein n=1 Tax=Striga asiatica TaxID=4170 RepID=A0A5A7REW4_STRAF|nr:dentin sialophospho protein [Striga asiatica]